MMIQQWNRRKRGWDTVTKPLFRPKVDTDHLLSFYSYKTAPDKVRVTAGYYGVGGRQAITLVEAATLDVTTTGHGWLQVEKISAGLKSLEYAATLPDMASTTFFVWRIFSANVSGGQLQITSRNPGDKYAHTSMLG